MIDCSVSAGIATITLDRPEARNAIAIADWQALATAAREIGDSDARVVILCSGHAGIFSAGADIGEFPSLQNDPERRRTFRRAMFDAIEAMVALPMPSIAAVDGGCFGAAVALVLACDIRIAGPDARFATTPAKLGLGYPASDVARLTATVGRNTAARMLFSGEPLDRDQAVRVGLAEGADGSADEAAITLAQRIAANRPEAIRLLKRTLRNPGESGLDQAFDDRFGSAEFAAGLNAFRNRGRSE